MSRAQKELEKELREAGNRLSQLPTQVNELLPLLDQVESLLSKVEQSPSEAIQNAYYPSMKALVAESLLRHSDVDVKVATASCISEITRITAPEAPYNDDQMKDVFQLIVSSFENLSDNSSRSYNKRALILETVAKVRSCVVMLDLECDGLIAEMFQNFLNSIRDYHPENVYTSMETIMTLVLEESEDISLELLKPLLASVKRDNEEIATIGRKLARSVFEKCAVKIKPYLADAVKSLGVSLDDYSEIVALIGNGTAGDLALDDDKDSRDQLAEETKLSSLDAAAQEDENKLNTASSEKTSQDAEEHVAVEDHVEEVPPEAHNSLKSVLSNGMTVTGDEETTGVSHSSKKPDEDGDKEAEITCQKISDTEPEKLPDIQKIDGKDMDASSGEDQHVDTGVSSDKGKRRTTPISSPNLANTKSNVACPSPNETLPDKSLPNKPGMRKKEEILDQEDATSVNPFPSKLVDGTSALEVKPQRHPEKEEGDMTCKDAHSVDLVSTKAADSTSNVEVKSQRQSRKKKVKLVQEDELPSGNPLSVNVADGTSDSEVKPSRQPIQKKGNLTQEDATSVGLVSAEVADGTIDSEVKVQRDSEKNKVNLVEEDVEPVKVADGTNDSEVKPQRHSGKKATSQITKKAADHITKEEMMLAGGSTSKIEGEATSDSEAKQLRQSVTKGDANNSEGNPLEQSDEEETSRPRRQLLKQSGKKRKARNSEAKPHELSGKEERSRPRGQLLKQSSKEGYASDVEKPSFKKKDMSDEDKVSLRKGNGKRSARGKDTKEKDLSMSSAKENDQDMVSPSKSVKDDDSIEQPEINSKRKRTPGKDKIAENIEYGVDLVGAKVKVWWPDDHAFYEGVVESFDPVKKKHKVSYTDGDEEILFLQKEKWKFVEDGTVEEEASEDLTRDSSAKLQKRKRAKPNSELLPKQKKTGMSPKRGGAASSSKSKGVATKSGGKIDDGKVGSKLKDKTSTPTGKSEHNLRKSDSRSADVPAAASKSKDDGGTPKITTRSKEETPKTINKSKGKTPESGNRSSSSKVKDTEDKKHKSSDSGKIQEVLKGKSGKKRKRGSK